MRDEPLFSKPNGRELWVMILEKAWVKNYGHYLNADRILPENVMEDILGHPCYGFWTKGYDELHLS